MGVDQFAERVGVEKQVITNLEDSVYRGCPTCEFYRIVDNLGPGDLGGGYEFSHIHWSVYDKNKEF